MAKIIELKCGERPPARVRHALVISSLTIPSHGAASLNRGTSKTFYATITDRDVALIVGRAMTWADARQIVNVCLRRE